MFFIHFPQRFKAFICLTSVAITVSSCSLFHKSTNTTKNNTDVSVSTNNNTNLSDAEYGLRIGVVEYAKSFIGVRYKYAGYSPSGFDCSGFTSYCMANAADVTISHASKAQAKEGKSIPLKEVKPGDLVFFTHRRGTVGHVALVVEKKDDGIYVIHATNTGGVMINNISTSKYWKPKILYARDVLSK